MESNTPPRQNRPKCKINISIKCTNDVPRDAIMMIKDNSGNMIPSCHHCSWLKTRGSEWNPGG